MMKLLLAALKQALIDAEIVSEAAPILVDALGAAFEEGVDASITQTIADAINEIADDADVAAVASAIQTAYENI